MQGDFVVTTVDKMRREGDEMMINVNSKPAFKVVSQEFNCDECEMKITLKDNCGLIFKTTSRQIMNNATLVNNMSNQDAVRIGYIAGFENSNYY